MATVGLQRRPAGVRRRVVSASALVVVAVLAGVFAFANELRHPWIDDGELADAAVIGDPRDEVACPDSNELGEEAGDGPRLPDEPLDVDSGDLLACPRTYDGELVRYVGEPVGEVLQRRGRAWVQLNDDVYSQTAPLPLRGDFAGINSGIGARLPANGAAAIDHVGGPRRRGDLIAVEGRFHRALPTTADTMAIDARRVQQLRPGEPIEHGVLADRRLAAITLGVLAVAMVFGERLVARRRR